MLRVTETMLKRDQIYLSATQKDTEAALSLMEGLERFAVPRTMEVASGMEPMARHRKVMRHGQENPRVSELPPLVIEKLGESAVMVLVCSSSSSTSRWIRAEVEEFYRTHPRGPVIPVVLDGEPDPDHSRQAFEKPCFPENLKKADMERWVDGRGTDWAETAPVAALATILGVRIEQLIHHEALRSRRMKKQRSLALWALFAVIFLACLWTLRWPLHEAAKQRPAIYAESWAAAVEQWLASVEPGGRPQPAFPTQPGSLDITGAAPSPAPATAPANPPAPQTAAEPEAAPSKPAGFLESLPKTDPVAFQLAANAWLDEAEKYLPEQLSQAERWIQKALEGLENGDGVDFGNELYRAHALSAVVAQRRRHSELSSRELLTAVGHWTAIPIQDLDNREEEGFNILTTIAPTQEWRESALKMVAWIGSLPGDEPKVAQRAGRLIDLLEVHPFLTSAVEGWLAKAASSIQPPPSDPAGTAARFALLRANLLWGRQDRAGAVSALETGESALAAAANPDSALHRALQAQFQYRKTAYSEAAVPASGLEKNLNQMQEGQTVPGWETWFSEDLRAGWARLGDMQLRQDAFAEAIAAYNRALEFTKNPPELARILLKSGCSYRYQGDPAGAWDAFSLAIPIFEEAKDDASLLTALWGGVLAAKDLKRKEGTELQQRAQQLQAKLGASYQPPDFWRDKIEPAEVASPAAASVSSKPDSSPSPPPSKPAPPAPSKPAPPAPSKAAAPAPATLAASQPAAASGLTPTSAPEPAGKSTSGTVSTDKKDTPADIDARIAALQDQIAKLEADSKQRRTFKGLQELQSLYSELDTLLRRKLSTTPRT